MRQVRHGNIAAAAGIVGFADLLLGSAVERILEAHIACWRRPVFAVFVFPRPGTGHSLIGSNSNTPNLLSDSRFREGFAKLQKYNLTFDAWIYLPTQLPGLTELARVFPDTTIILDHIGTPLGIGPYSGKRDEVFQDEERNRSNMSTCPKRNNQARRPWYAFVRLRLAGTDNSCWLN